MVGTGGINEDKENDEETTPDRLDSSLAVHKCDLCENRTFREELFILHLHYILCFSNAKHLFSRHIFQGL